MIAQLLLVSVLISLSAADQACINRGGQCMVWPFNLCVAGWEVGLCNGGVNRRCCLQCNAQCLTNEQLWKAGDAICNAARGTCKHNSNFCNGNYAAGMCGGPATRQCCDPKRGAAGNCPLVPFGPTPNVKGFQNQIIRVDPGFVNSMNKVDNAAKQCNVVVYVTHSFRKQKQRLQGAIVQPAVRSNHLVGHAIDMNLQTNNGWCNSRCLRARNNQDANCFINGVKAAGLRWGGDFGRPDPVHIDDAFNANLNQWKARFNVLQNNC